METGLALHYGTNLCEGRVQRTGVDARRISFRRANDGRRAWVRAHWWKLPWGRIPWRRFPRGRKIYRGPWWRCRRPRALNSRPKEEARPTCHAGEGAIKPPYKDANEVSPRRG